MSEHRASVNLVLNGDFARQMAAASAVADRLAVDLERARATWEPIDWSDFA